MSRQDNDQTIHPRRKHQSTHSGNIRRSWSLPQSFLNIVSISVTNKVPRVVLHTVNIPRSQARRQSILTKLPHLPAIDAESTSPPDAIHILYHHCGGYRQQLTADKSGLEQPTVLEILLRMRSRRCMCLRTGQLCSVSNPVSKEVCLRR